MNLLEEVMSTHRAEVVRYTLEKHPNADSLSIAKIKGWQCVVRTLDFETRNVLFMDLNLGVYVPLDMIADKDHPLLNFLEGKRVKTKKLRGEVSQGVLLPLEKVLATYLIKKFPEEGDDLTEILQLKRWEPPVDLKDLLKTKEQKADIPRPDYLDRYTDIENIRNWNQIFQEGDQVIVTEKIHGSNFGAALISGKFYIASRNRVLRTEPVTVRKPRFKNRRMNKLLEKTFLWRFVTRAEVLAVDTTVWHRAAKEFDLEAKLKLVSKDLGNADVVIYGEVCPTQKLAYGCTPEKIGLFIFDIRARTADKDLGYLPQQQTIELMRKYSIPTVPVYYVGPFKESLLELRSGKSAVPGANHIKEGIVIQPITPQYNTKLGRVVLKLKSEEFLLKDYE